MSLHHADRIAKALLYEGYMLYPYRPSSVKNRQRFNFGVVYPDAWASAHGGTDGSFTRTECVVVGDDVTTIDAATASDRDETLMRSLVSAHTVLSVAEGAEFISSLDPPDAVRRLVADCRNVGTWPVLVGERGDAHTMLSSPIILYDHPE